MRNHALYAQDQWTFGKMTLSGALRYDHASSWAPEQRLESRFFNAPLSWDRTPVVDSYNDITPRFSFAYDVFGNGKTAVKATLGKYLESTVTASNYSLGNPTSRIATNSARTWTDGNGNWLPDCDFRNPEIQDNIAAGGDFCGVAGNRNFGTANFNNTIDPDILHGWGVRPSDWNWGVSVQQEVLPRVSVEVGFFHREFFGFTVTDNLAVGPENFDKFTLTAPQDSRLPDGGGYTVGPIFDLNTPSLAGVTRNYITYSDKYGDQYQRFNGIDVNISARPRGGLTAQGGFSAGKGVSDNCEVRDKVPEIALVGGVWRDVHEQAGREPERLRHAAAGRCVPGQLRRIGHGGGGHPRPAPVG
jgi:hypothetical protein